MEINEASAQGSRDDVLELRTRIDVMVQSLRVFADEVTRVAEMALRNRTIELTCVKAELASVHRELARRTYELERAQTARSRFYAAMSHELRTPITAILGYSALLGDELYGTLNEQQTRAIERTRCAAQHLLELVNDVLDLSKIEAGRIELRLEPIAFPALLEDLSATLRPQAEARGSLLEIEHQGEPIVVISDPRRVRQILMNLVSNAIMFGRGRPVRIVSRAWADSGIEIRVIDQGEGIAAADQERIFDEFVRLSDDHSAGTGLGLPISRRLATCLNGSLTVQSAPGEGSVFCLHLPRMADALAGLTPELSPARSAA
jgi:signal transduction histidine kinase